MLQLAILKIASLSLSPSLRLLNYKVFIRDSIWNEEIIIVNPIKYTQLSRGRSKREMAPGPRRGKQAIYFVFIFIKWKFFFFWLWASERERERKKNVFVLILVSFLDLYSHSHSKSSMSVNKNEPFNIHDCRLGATNERTPHFWKQIIQSFLRFHFVWF